jgi:hypothetical protein
MIKERSKEKKVRSKDIETTNRKHYYFLSISLLLTSFSFVLSFIMWSLSSI